MTVRSRTDMQWLVSENRKLYNCFQHQQAQERHGIIGKILCLVGFHKWRAYQYQTHKAEDNIMAHYFGCIRCGKGISKI